MKAMNLRPMSFQFSITYKNKLYTFEYCTNSYELSHVGLGESEPPNKVWQKASEYGESLGRHEANQVSPSIVTL